MQEFEYREYRGKRIDNGEWVYGCLSYLIFGEVYIIGERIEDDPETDITFTELDKMVHEVIPESVGQFTGKCKNGIKLFEGDIIKRTSISKINKLDPLSNTYELGVIRYDKERLRYRLVTFKEEGEFPVPPPLATYSYELIGNATDNSIESIILEIEGN